jgi:mono/diheme cytochrome c family protein
MTRFTSAAVIVVAFIAALVVACKKDGGTTQPIQPADTTHIPSILGGQYLAVTIAQCDVCHTPLDPMGKPDYTHVYAGGMRFNLGSAGVVYSRNITPNSSEGIGVWSNQQIRSAITAGVVPKHYIGGALSDTLLTSAMPYYLYANLADTDLVDIVAFIRNVSANSTPSVPDTVNPIAKAHVERISLPTPLSNTPQLNRGRYLVAIGLCADCHTPLDAAGHLDMTKFLSGGRDYEGFLPGVIVHSSNITSDNATGIGMWTDAEIKTALTSGLDKAGRHLCPPMPWAKFKNLKPSDLDAIVAYIRTVQAVNNDAGENPDCPH